MTQIRYELESRGVKMQEFAKALGVSRSQLSQWMKGHRSPSGTAMLAIRLVYAMQFKDKPKKP